ncbi:MAG: beta-ketoacyl-ACP synthase II [Planctomycetota bacterium]|nr:beta-ketoacyl-ACP synthase II [Planctomycetota bacterium]MDA1105938.1 beta-ketoacyl-ACP synthase II [Planctomycetota bacterium]
MRTVQLRRVVVTGIGALTDVGHTAPATWESLLAGRSGIDTISGFDQSIDWVCRIGGEVRGVNLDAVIDPREQKRMDRFCLFGVYAASEAAQDCGFDFKSGDPWRRGVAIGSGIGGIGTIEIGYRTLVQTGPSKINPFTVPKLMANSCAGHVSIRFNLKGSNTCTATACASGSHSIGAAFRAIQLDEADLMIAGGAEGACTPLCLSSFAAMKALSTRNDEPTKASRPFDRDRDGFVMSEGAGIIVLEELGHAKARGAKIYAELVGYGSSGDASHIAAPDPQGAGARHAMAMALRDAGLNADQIGYINAHGTSTPLGDAAEVSAVKSLFGAHAFALAMSSTKSCTGHALGAAGGIESVATVLAVRDGVMPPTINLDSPDDGFDLDFVAHAAKERRLTHAINNSFGFGGHNTSLVFARFGG